MSAPVPVDLRPSRRPRIPCGGECRSRSLVARLLVLVTVALSPTGVGATEYHVDTTAHRLARFISDAPLEDFDGITDRIDGYVVVAVDTVPGGGAAPKHEFYFEVELNALDTGIGLRNRHMRENYLETDEYPIARYAGRGGALTPASDSTFVVSADGELTIHGVARPLRTTVTVTPDGRRYRVHAQFPAALPDFKIKVPKLMFLKISDTVQVQIDVTLFPVAGAEEGR